MKALQDNGSGEDIVNMKNMEVSFLKLKEGAPKLWQIFQDFSRGRFNKESEDDMDYQRVFRNDLLKKVEYQDAHIFIFLTENSFGHSIYTLVSKSKNNDKRVFRVTSERRQMIFFYKDLFQHLAIK